MMFLILADNIPNPVPGTEWPWLLNLFCAAAVLAIFLGIAVAIKTLIAKPVIQKIEQPMIVRMEEQFVPRKEFEKTSAQFRLSLEKLEEQLSAQVVTIEKYVHDMRHEIRNELQGMEGKGELRSSKTHQRIDTLSNLTHEILGIVKSRGAERQ